MRKILFVMFAAIAFVACEKEEANEEVKYNRYYPILYPNAISCLDNAGMTLEIKSDRQSKFLAACIVNDEEPIRTQEDEINSTHYETDNDRYHITQIDEYTYQLTIKPFVEQRRLALYFINPKDNYERIGLVVATCGYELESSTKEYLDKLHKWAKEDEQ